MSFLEDGFEVLSQFFEQDILAEIISEIETTSFGVASCGLRNAEKKLSSIQKLINSDQLKSKIATYFSSPVQVVRVLVFDKTPDKNWLVTWHQDKTISVTNNADIPGWGPWTIKDGVHHVQPSQAVLENMVTFRIHLDDADESNGCLKVIPKSHRLGILSRGDQDNLVSNSESVLCSAKAGDVLVMKPLLLHASSKGSLKRNSYSHRRVFISNIVITGCL